MFDTITGRVSGDENGRTDEYDLAPRRRRDFGQDAECGHSILTGNWLPRSDK